MEINRWINGLHVFVLQFWISNVKRETGIQVDTQNLHLNLTETNLNYCISCAPKPRYSNVSNQSLSVKSWHAS
jgi:hypothetical protein